MSTTNAPIHRLSNEESSVHTGARSDASRRDRARRRLRRRGFDGAAAPPPCARAEDSESNSERPTSTISFAAREASQRERQAVATLAEGVGVPLTTGEGDVRAYAREKRSGIEEAARELRYAFLAKAAREQGANVVAVGHTADDQVETVLMHILRGSGLSGLAGMLPRSPWPDARRRDLALVRPLLEVRRRRQRRTVARWGESR